ncbi:hypothetical protein [Desulfoluna spongiiphila]|uniref:Uncharacterized protein n=1 Tax=Desulfoluna spongiiphila TaxID=419481 RepID=A0A1G5FZ31_9BACT|nr:hypothetical protein [Desulfoluna spongiiphila]SCY44592.1 hypothetical protein SAMN05216233_109103 [Desulfoluna spongiiphila]
MGKATIISGGEDGLYEADIVYNLDRIKARIVQLKAQIEELQTEIEKLELTEDKTGMPLLKIQMAALQKVVAMLEAIPETKRVSVWAADLNEELSGIVGTVEVPDDPARGVNIFPGGVNGDQADYDAERDGIINPIMNMGPASAFFLRAIMPGIQKHKPRFRYGTITAISGDECSVNLEGAPDVNQQSVNQTATLSGVDIEYLFCNGGAFKLGDEVLIMFERTWGTPKVVGFKDNPKPCPPKLYMSIGDVAGVWDLATDDWAIIHDEVGDVIPMPSTVTDLSGWLQNAVSPPSVNDAFHSVPINDYEDGPVYFPEQTACNCNGTEYVNETRFTQGSGPSDPPDPDVGDYYWHSGSTTSSGTFYGGATIFGASLNTGGVCLNGASPMSSGGICAIKREYNANTVSSFLCLKEGGIQYNIWESSATTVCTLICPLGSGTPMAHGFFDDTMKYVQEGDALSFHFDPDFVTRKNIDAVCNAAVINTDRAVCQVYTSRMNRKKGEGAFKLRATIGADWTRDGDSVWEVMIAAEAQEDPLIETGYALQEAPRNQALEAMVQGYLNEHKPESVEITTVFKL